MPQFGHERPRDPNDVFDDELARRGPSPARGRFGDSVPADGALSAAAERVLPSRPPGGPTSPPPSPSGGGPRPAVVWIAVAVVLAVLVAGAGVVLIAPGEDGATDESPASLPFGEPTVAPSTTIGFQVTVPTTVPPPTTEAWTPETPPKDALVYPSPGLVQPQRTHIEFRGASTVETLILSNNGGGAADWLLSVPPGSGLDVSPSAGQLRPGESIEVRVLLDRANGRDLTDWAETLSMIGGGNTRPTKVNVQIFEI